MKLCMGGTVGGIGADDALKCHGKSVVWGHEFGGLRLRHFNVPQQLTPSRKPRTRVALHSAVVSHGPIVPHTSPRMLGVRRRRSGGIEC